MVYRKGELNSGRIDMYLAQGKSDQSLKTTAVLRPRVPMQSPPSRRVFSKTVSNPIDSRHGVPNFSAVSAELVMGKGNEGSQNHRRCHLRP